MPLAAPLITTHRVISYTYDSLYRLITATYSSGEYYHYTYDAVGNRQSLTTHQDVVNYQYDDANRLTSVNGQAYTWDDNGNLLSDGLRTYTYDHANHLTQVVSGTLTTGFIYNGAGDRVAKTVDGVETRYTLDPAAGLTQVLQETTDGQATSYLYGADLLAQYDSGTWAYHVNDGLGSVRQLADPAGQVMASYSFSPFGVPLGESGGEPYGYTGEQWDASAGLVFLRARMYQPGTGRFLTSDPWFGDTLRPQTLNRYLYVTNNAVTLVDPSGLKLWRKSTSWVEQIIEEVYEAGQAHIHLEYSLPIGGWRPDILNSLTGEVFEIKPLVVGPFIAAAEAGIYAFALNHLKAGSLLGGPTGLLPLSDPNNWNVVNWQPNAITSFPPLVIPGMTTIYTAHGVHRINAPFDLVAMSMLPGSVVWWFQPKPTVAAALIAAYLAEEYWSKHVVGAAGLRELPATCPIIVIPKFLLDPTDPRFYDPWSWLRPQTGA